MTAAALRVCLVVRTRQRQRWQDLQERGKGEAGRVVWRAEARLRPGHGRPRQVTLQLAQRALQQEQGGQGQRLPRGGADGTRWRFQARMMSNWGQRQGLRREPSSRSLAVSWSQKNI